MRSPRDNSKILARKLNALYPEASQHDKAVQILAEYGKGRHDKEPERVRLAILKLSGADLGKLEHNTTRAKQDYRDVLAWAEYPGQSKNWSIMKGPQKEKLKKADLDEYEAWLME